jgi:hypothetical protein
MRQNRLFETREFVRGRQSTGALRPRSTLPKPRPAKWPFYSLVKRIAQGDGNIATAAGSPLLSLEIP